MTSVVTLGEQGPRGEEGGAEPGRSVTPNEASDGEFLTSGEHIRNDPSEERPEVDLDEVPISVEEWLPPELRSKYADILKRHGFDNTLFIKALTEKELNRMGIVKRGHVQFLLAQIALLPAFEIEFQVPTNVKDWLNDIGLIMYRENFRRNHIRKPKEMEILKRFDRKDISRELGISKEGHIKRLLYAIRMLRDPSEGQLRAMKMRQAIDDSPVHYLIENNVAEFAFWNALRDKCLEPDLKAFGIEAEVKEKLIQLRNNWLTILAVSNTLWLILISTLATKADLTVIGANPIGLVFLFIFGFLFLLQFLLMLVHRTYTMSHYLARASYKYGKPLHTNWSFKDKSHEHFEDTEDQNAIRQIKYDEDRAFRRTLQSKKRDKKANATGPANERTPLIPNL
ncbi:hypothetical protein EGW08_003511 [Elysia chlorotica]|uniref:SAM domain-containing protein n=1 Tax=Elysia chlorotica TaxID=188477 RepID=A0A3S1HYL1_ELYCH|nr:hypothetical protein EGW08_003511 [Elysia chlorotica]